MPSAILLIANSSLLGDNIMISGHITALKKKINNKISVVCHEKVVPLFQMMGVIVIPFDVDRFQDKNPLPAQFNHLNFNYILNYNYSIGSYFFIKRLNKLTLEQRETLNVPPNVSRLSYCYGFESFEINKEMCKEIYTKYIGLEDWDNGIRNQPSYLTLGRILMLMDTSIEPELPQLSVSRKDEFEIKEILNLQNINLPFICFNPGASSQNKRWFLKSFIDVAEKLIFKNNCVFHFGPNEADLQKEFEYILKDSRIKAITGISIKQLAALFSIAKLNITNDTGPMHISCAVHCPTIALFGSTNSKVWFPYDKSKHKVFEKTCASYENCDSCAKRDDCVQDIKYLDVVESAFEILHLA